MPTRKSTTECDSFTPPLAHGQCFCGAVQITVDVPVAWVAHCHCSMCRRYHGAPFVTWFGVRHGHYRINDEAITWYRSSAEAERGRCKHCGSVLLFRSQRWPDELHITLAAMHEPVGREPQMHVYYGDRVRWAPLAPHEPCYRTVPSEDGTPIRD
jgi:hypothetical protein